MSCSSFALGYTMAVILERKKAISETIWNAEIQERINKIDLKKANENSEVDFPENEKYN